ncbi:MAG: prephenate dehydratase [Nitrososphaerales archaeon]
MVAYKVAFQGERGAYSEQAALKYFKEGIELLPLRSLFDVFDAIENYKADYGIAPIENSIEGSVNETYDLLLEKDLKVIGEVKERIVHCLIVHPEIKDIKELKVVYSHHQALAQCRNFLKKMNLPYEPYYDTAGSVKMIKEKGYKQAGAIAGERASQIYSMKILFKGIEDNASNFTRFLILSREPLNKKSKRDKTSIIFTTKHEPGALYRALEEFALRNINLTMIVSRPTKTKPWEYNFYLDFEGNLQDKLVMEVLKGLEKKTSFIKVLGSYPSH